MLKIDMFSKADKVKGQGVGSAYLELINLLKSQFPDEFDIQINKFDKADISHYHTINPSFFLSTFSKKRGRKIGYVHFLPETLEGSLKIPAPFRQIFYRYVIAFYKRMDHLVVVNPSFIPKLTQYGIDKNKITYIPNFVSRSEFYPVKKSQKCLLRERYNYPSDSFLVLGTGQVQTRKGVLDFAELARQNPEVQFVWAGGFSFGKMTAGYHELKKLTDNPPKNLSFPGIVDRKQLVDYYDMADLFLLPSYNELFPMSVLEAFSCGIPVMLRDLTLYHEILGNDYIKADNEAEMDQKLSDLMKNPKQLSQYAKRSREAANRYSEEHLASIWRKFYLEQARAAKGK